MRSFVSDLTGAARTAAGISLGVFAIALVSGQHLALAPLYVLPLCLATRLPGRAPLRAVGTLVVALAMLGALFVSVAGQPQSGLLGLLAVAAAFIMLTRHLLAHASTTSDLRGREANLQAITDAIPGAVFQFESAPDGSAAFTFMSRGVCSLIDFEAGDAPLSLEHLLAHVLPEDLPALQASIAAAVAARATWGHEFRIHTAQGRLKWLNARSTPERVGSDGRLHFNGLIVDVTERVAAEQAAEQAHHARDRILEAAGEGIFGIDYEGRVSFVNPAAARMLGWSGDALIGRSFLTLLDDADKLPENFMAMSCCTTDSCRHVTDTVFRRQDGSTFAVDFVCTPLVEQGTVRGAVVVFRDISEARRLSEALRHQATHDELTGLVNRRDFEQRVGDVLARQSDKAGEHVLAFVDLDQFKVINDTCGHIAGDELLRQVARLIETQLRRSDTLARIGGDEFGILMEHCSVAQAQVVMERLRLRVSEFRYSWDDKTFKLGVSIGLVPLGGEDMELSEVLRRADAACYAAKDAGRNRIHSYHEGDAELARRHGEMQWVSRITQALERDEFELYAQPIVNTGAHDGDDAHDVHYEILIRLREANGTIVAPGAFLPAAERYNLSPLIDRWVMKTALSWLASHPASLDEVSLCCINLSGLTLCDDESREYIIAQFMQSGVPPAKICFEVTETAAIANLERATVFIDALKALGCRFALDDFGSGLSSFAYLKNLPVDFLKIDGMFVRDILDDAMDLAIVRSINDVGHALGMRTIGEFVENDAVLRRLAELGVDYAQGYGVGRPRPLADLPQMAKAAAEAAAIARTANGETRQVA